MRHMLISQLVGLVRAGV